MTNRRKNRPRRPTLGFYCIHYNCYKQINVGLSVVLLTW